MLSDVYDIRVADGPPMLLAERGCRAGWPSTSGIRTFGSAVRDMQQAKQVESTPGCSISWSGQFKFLERATARW